MKNLPDMLALKDRVSLNTWLTRAKSYTLFISEGALDLVVSLIIMVMVERSLGAAGLGVFAYLLSLLMFGGLISEFGITQFLEREIAITKEQHLQNQHIEKTACAVLATSIACGLFFIITAIFNTSHTKIEETAFAYAIIGITVPICNLNRIKIAILQGEGQFGITTKLKAFKRVVLFGGVFLLMIGNMPPSYLMAAYLISELGMMIKARKSAKLPKFKTMWHKSTHIESILSQSRRFFLTGDAMQMVLYMDFLILGIFVSSADLGLYAEASIMARIFMLVPSSIKPIFRKQYCTLASNNRLGDASGSPQVVMAMLFYGHAILMVFFLLFFPQILQWVFPDQERSLIPFYLFAEILPGLLFFSVVNSQESLYEAEKKVIHLQKTVMTVVLLNIGLNCFFVPFAGFFGAAFATSCSTFVYFILFGKHLKPEFQLNKFKYITAGAVVYLLYMLCEKLEIGFTMAFFLVPGLLFVCFFLINFFDFESKTSRSNQRLAME